MLGCISIITVLVDYSALRRVGIWKMVGSVGLLRVGRTGSGLVGHHWQDKNAMTSILWLHFCVLGVGALLVVYKAVS